jgi:hypothetical protein
MRVEVKNCAAYGVGWNFDTAAGHGELEHSASEAASVASVILADHRVSLWTGVARSSGSLERVLSTPLSSSVEQG